MIYVLVYNCATSSHEKTKSVFNVELFFFLVKLDQGLPSNSKYTMPLFCHSQYDIHILMISMLIAREKHNLSIFTLSAVGPR